MNICPTESEKSGRQSSLQSRSLLVLTLKAGPSRFHGPLTATQVGHYVMPTNTATQATLDAASRAGSYLRLCACYNRGSSPELISIHPIAQQDDIILVDTAYDFFDQIKIE